MESTILSERPILSIPVRFSASSAYPLSLEAAEVLESLRILLKSP